MKLNSYLGVSDINPTIFSTIRKSLKNNYKIYGKISQYSNILELLSHNTQHKWLNHKYKLLKLIKKNIEYRILALSIKG